MRVTTLSIGDELTHGAILDRHGGWFAGRFDALGCDLVEHRMVGDDRDLIAASIRELAASSDLLVVTGGLGPTADDLTREALADALGESLVLDPEALAALEDRFASRGRVLSESNRRQAHRPEHARSLPNANGTAPGLEARLGDSRIVVLPGPPHEMHPMFESVIASGIEPSADHEATIDINGYGLPESRAAERLGPLLERDRDPLVGIKVSWSILTASVRGTGVEAVARAIERHWHPLAYGRGATTLEEVVGGLLEQQGSTIATAESCTGGLLGGRITEVPGSSGWYGGGVVTYSNECKQQLLGVPAELLERHGAVSEQVAVVMAMEAARRFGADYALSTTGIAGPGGGGEHKPVGTVWIGGCDTTGDHPNAWARRFVFPGDRTWVRDRTVKSALQMLRLHILGFESPLLWEAEQS
ncbi:MAG: CinA family nicotinamide mononucleotide deamidase-related protein [Phycisphaerales bacterium]|nr:CinA family nicotinamide mononucleotide deamidase-related protein [Phycisphaerales bacterium]